MVFSTPLFMFYFLVLTMGIYFVVPRRFRNLVLLVSSLLFIFVIPEKQTRFSQLNK
jgi:alginate O-acetyltransferase complex protein AlgI